jgi:hypothetical protein
MDKMFSLILNVELSKEFYSKKMKVKPSNKAPLSCFKSTLLKWVQNTTPKTLIVREILVDTHYRFNRVGSMAGLKEVINTPKLASFL